MPKESIAAVSRRRLLGLLLIAIIVGSIAMSIAIYDKAFTKTVDVTLEANHVGNQLQKESDVKERGVIVGSVKTVRANGSNAIVTLSLQPSRVKDIPKDVKAQILPKTLFGEQYVSLILPKGSDGVSGNPIAAGDVIPQDRSKGALEAQDVLADLYPVLTDIQPAELNSTLTALATALQGRGKELGDILVNLHTYLTKINPHTQQFVDDLDKLGKVSLEYNSVSPDLFATLRNLETSVHTIVQRRQSFGQLLTTGSSTSQILSSFLSDNRQRLIDVAGQSKQLYALLAEYSPEFSCLANGVNQLADGVGTAINHGSIHLNITADGKDSTGTQSRGPYKNGEQPKYVTGYGPDCFGLPTPPTSGGNFQIPGKYRCLNDGAPFTDDACATTTSRRTDTSAFGSPQESALVNTLIAGQLHTTPNRVPGGTTLLAAPLLRGHKVVVK